MAGVSWPEPGDTSFCSTITFAFRYPLLLSAFILPRTTEFPGSTAAAGHWTEFQAANCVNDRCNVGIAAAVDPPQPIDHRSFLRDQPFRTLFCSLYILDTLTNQPICHFVRRLCATLSNITLLLFFLLSSISCWRWQRRRWWRKKRRRRF